MRGMKYAARWEVLGALGLANARGAGHERKQLGTAILYAERGSRRNFVAKSSMLRVIKSRRRHGRHSCGNCCELSEAHSR